MKRRAVAVALIVATTACSSMNKEVAIRSVNSGADGAAQDALARGDLLFSRGEHALALDAYRRAMRKDPADAHALNGVAISYAAIGRHDLAREFFELALARAPQDERIHRNFARSLSAQGLRSEADALLAELGGGAPKLASRPTLAQLAAVRTPAAAGPARLSAVGLERVSMGEVRLRTAPSALPGRMTSQLSTAIVTVAEGEGATPAASLSRELNAPIVQMSPRPAVAPASSLPAARAAVAAVAPVRKPAIAVAADCGDAKGARLRATGYTIDLVTQPEAKASGTCRGLAGSETRDGLFKKLWKWSGRLG